MKKHLIKSISSLNNYDFSINEKDINTGFKFPNPKINIKKNKNFLISLNLNQKKFSYTNRKNKTNETLNINLLKSPINKILTLRKTRNKTMRNLLKNICNIELFEKLNSKDKEKEKTDTNNKDNFLLLTSLYNLPKIKKPVKLSKKIYFNSHFSDTTKNEHYTGQNNSTINDKSIFNESMTTSNDKSTFNYMNLLYNNESKTSQRKSSFKKKKRLLSNLSSLLKNKYYSDTENKLKDKITVRSFPLDNSMKDKVIHMKKVGVFWDSVFNYCVPIINVKKYKAQRDLSEKKKLEYLKLIQNKSIYYEKLKSKNINCFRKKMDKSNSQPKFFTPRIIK